MLRRELSTNAFLQKHAINLGPGNWTSWIFPESYCEGFSPTRHLKKSSITSPTSSSSHHLTYIVIIYTNIIYINITYLVIYITYITYIIYIMYIFYNIIIYVIIYINIIYTIYIIIYIYIIYINIMYIIFQELIRRRKTPIDSGVNTQEKNSDQELLQKTPTKLLHLKFY